MVILKNLKVKTRLIISFLIIAVLIAVVGIIGIISLQKVNDNSRNMYSNNLQNIYLLSVIKQNSVENENSILQLTYAKDTSKIHKLEQEIAMNAKDNDKKMRSFNNVHMTQKERKEWTDFVNEVDTYRDIRNNIISYINSNNMNQAVKIYDEMSKVKNKMFKNLDNLIYINHNNAEINNNNNNSIYMTSNTFMGIFIMVGLISAILIGIFTANYVNYNLTKILEFAKRMSEYNFSYKWNIIRNDEFGKTGKALAKAQNNIKSILKIIMNNSQDMSASSEELSAIVQELSTKFKDIDNSTKEISKSVEENSSSSQQITASIEEVDSSINELSTKASKANKVSNSAKDRSTEIKNRVKTSLENSKNIYKEKSSSILKAIEDGKIVSNIKVMADTIAGIADQTNLLALNAAIEAARAGEHGKGFSVVAEEVRQLAQKSSEAVIGIQDTIERVQNAFRNLSDNSSDILKFFNEDLLKQFNYFENVGDKYYEDADFINNMSSEIASMAEQLTATIDQVSEATQVISGLAQKSLENTDTIKNNVEDVTNSMEQVAGTSESQADMAQGLNEIVQKFTI